MAATEPEWVGERRGQISWLRRVQPHTLPAQATLEALYANEGKEQPEKRNQEEDSDQQGKDPVEAPKNGLIPGVRIPCIDRVEGDIQQCLKSRPSA